MLARRLSADEAERIGLITAACEPGEVRAEAVVQAERLAAMPRSSMRLIKRALNDGYDAGLVGGLAVEREAAIEALLSAEAREGISAFLEKRPANFD
jgi:enoyl-CoA hydratase/carnithine racemase